MALSLAAQFADAITDGLVSPDFRATIKPSYTPYGSNLVAWESTEPEVIISGPAGTGKSRAWLEKMHYLAEKYPGFRGLIVRQTRVSLNETGLQTFEDFVLGRQHPILNPKRSNKPERSNRQAYRYPNGSTIIPGGMDNSNRILSGEYDMIFFQEAIEAKILGYEDLTTRLRNNAMPYQQMVSDTNPGPPSHWLKRRADSGTLRMLYGKHEDNPVLYNHDAGTWTPRGLQYLAVLDNLTGVRKQRKRYGLWVQSEGAVYDDFDESVHVIDRFDIPEVWPVFCAYDYGYTNPFVAQWWAQDPDGRLILYREIYMTRRTVRAHTDQIQRLETGYNVARWAGLSDDDKRAAWRESSEYRRCQIRVADHDAEDRATMREMGVDTTAARKDIRTGIEAVQNRLLIAGDGKPRLYYMRDSLVELDSELREKEKPINTAEEFPAYIWAEGRDGRNDKELPLDAFNHGMDAMRYLVMEVDKPGGYKSEVW